ncbi:MAG: UDP-N-acetylglucosamine--N-acetylmuramyl-(pentapeptide) pyrophosphoryl-undecaprenol N-acetylglucosamine transferase [Bifidobacteriaceae bacterium]|nr:UDP-N-acetylglucosamine--N-acetylmuramyl-(pentapeptide) pyrophosphoryl-undecaprenol N-acetylglucosamine transferase [Bifidobacteriaceae bacterium]
MKRLEPTANITVVGTKVGLEYRLVPEAGFELFTIDKVPFPRSINASTFTFPFRWLKQIRSLRAMLQQKQVDVVVGFGGYTAAPVYSAAHREGVPIVVHEQNARAGLANKLGARWADYIGTAFDNCGLQSKHAPVERVGLPLRPAVSAMCERMQPENRSSNRIQACQELGLDPTRPIVVVTGGSLGAVNINRAMAYASKDLLTTAQVVHLTGRGKDEEVRAIVSEVVGEQVINDLNPLNFGKGDYHIAPYFERIDLAFACADLVICRAGAGTVCELSALGVPAIYVPLPIGNGEQRFNAQPVVDADGGILVQDSEFTKDWIVKHCLPLLANNQALEHMREQAWKYGIRDAALIMAKHVLEIARKE